MIPSELESVFDNGNKKAAVMETKQKTIIFRLQHELRNFNFFDCSINSDCEKTVNGSLLKQEQGIDQVGFAPFTFKS